jgi:hypothetical protein
MQPPKHGCPARARKPAAASVALLLLWSAHAGAEGAAGDAAATRFKILVDRDAAYRLRFEDLVAAGLPVDSRPATAALGLTNRGRPVSLQVDDGDDDGHLGPGDRIGFVGSHPRGEHSHFDPHTRHEVYSLSLAERSAPRFVTPDAPGCQGTARLARVVRMEEDRLRARFPGTSQETGEIWYWARLTSADAAPLEVGVDLPGLDATSASPVTLTLHFKGWSTLRQRGDGVFEHRVDVELDDQRLGAAEWNNADGGWSWRSPPIAAARLGAAGSQLRLSVPVRTGDGSDPLVDASLLDWIEIRYPIVGVPAAGSFWVESAPGGGCLPPAPGGVSIYGPGGERFTGAGRGWPVPPPGQGSLSGPYFVDDGRAPAAIRVDRPSALADGGEGADYLIVAHASLSDAVRPLAEWHRSAGMRVALVDVEDVYDEFSHGIVSPRAIRDFVRHAHGEWRPPAPRFLLLVGDASWDMRNDELRDELYADWTFRGQPNAGFVKNESTSLDGAPRRGLVPTWSSPTYEGDAASDNFFVAVAGDDELPDLAVGRFPAATPEEAAAMVEKTLEQHRAPPGSWRRRVLWLTNEQKHYQRRSDSMSRRADEQGLVSTRIYPAPEEPSNERHQAAIRSAFDQGHAVVHFVGHGGRYIWRTGPPDLRKNHDLFTLEDLEQLAPNARLPLVLSMTCYSAPFDHPTADSIGEKLLRLSGRGAAAVIAASWRNAPNREVDARLVQEVTAGGSVGEALQRVKREAGTPDFVRQYNLLGDPALPVPVPPRSIDLELVGDGPLRVRARVATAIDAQQALVEWIGPEGRLLGAEEVALQDGVADAAFTAGPEQAAEVTLVRAYAWGTAPGSEAVGALVVAPAREEAAPASRRGAGDGGG